MIVMNNATKPDAKANIPTNVHTGCRPEKNWKNMTMHVVANTRMMATTRMGLMTHEKMI